MDLAPRRQPRQSRAQGTIERILDATAELLDEGGLGGVNTNAIAARAGIDIKTLYSYYPNKFAVIVGLADRIDADRNALVEDTLTSRDWAEKVEATLNAFIESVISTPGTAALFIALRTAPELEGIDEQVHRRMADRIGRFLRDVPELQIPKREIPRISRVLIEAASGVIGFARRAPPRERRKIVSELTRMVMSYLSSRSDGL